MGLTLLVLLACDTAPEPGRNPHPPEPPCGADNPFIDVDVGGDGICGVHADGCLECWNQGERCLPPPHGSFTDVDVSRRRELSDTGVDCPVVCAERQDEASVCWGDHIYDVDGDGSFGYEAGPIGLDELFANLDSMCGLRGTELVCWWDFYGDVVRPLPAVSAVAMDGDELASLAVIYPDGSLESWWGGDYDAHETAEGPFANVAMSENQLCAVTVQGRVSCWSMGLDNAHLDPLELPWSDQQWQDVCVTDYWGETTCARSALGQVECHGEATGDEDWVDPPALPLVSMSCGWNSVCGLTSEGELFCWGTGAAYSYPGWY